MLYATELVTCEQVVTLVMHKLRWRRVALGYELVESVQSLSVLVSIKLMLKCGRK